MTPHTGHQPITRPLPTQDKTEKKMWASVPPVRSEPYPIIHTVRLQVLKLV
jgi:hypothetical protein